MELTDEYARDEVARLGFKADRVARNLPLRPQDTGEVTLTAAAGDSADETVTQGTVDEAVAELAARRGEDYAETYRQVRVLSGGERDAGSLASAVVALAHMPDSETVELTDVTVAERRELARKGHALPDGSYPIKTRAHLHAAATLAASGHGDVKAARELIRKRARELGVDPSTLPGFKDGDDQDGDDEPVKATHARLRRAGLSDSDIVTLAAGRDPNQAAQAQLAGSGGTVDAIVARYRGKGYFEDDHGKTSPRRRAGQKVTSKTRAHASDLQDDPTDSAAPHKGGVTHPEVARYLAMQKSLGHEAPSGSHVTHSR